MRKMVTGTIFLKNLIKIVPVTIFLLTFVWGAQDGRAQMTRDESIARFIKARFLYKNGDYPEAVAVYEAILEGGLESGALYFNLGNSYFKQGLLGKAVLNYERARRLIPRDSDVKANYKHALSLTKSHTAFSAQSFWQRKIDQHIQFFTMDEMTIILLTAGILLGGIYLVSLYFSWPGRQTKRCLVFLVLIFLASFLGFIAKQQSERNFAIAILTSDSKFEPRQEATTHFTLQEGEKVKILKSMGMWVKIQRLDGKAGWILKESMEEI